MPNARNDLAATELGIRLAELNKQHPDHPSPKTIERWMLLNLGFEVSDEQIRRAHAGLIDPTSTGAGDLLNALCAFYECVPADLGRFAEERMRLTRTLALAAVGGGDNGPDTPSSLGNPPTAWKAESGRVVPLCLAS